MKLPSKLAALLALVSLGCAGPGDGAPVDEEPLVPGLVGSWRATRLVLASPAGGPADLVALGGASWVTFDADGRMVITTQDPGEGPVATVGSWSALSPGELEVRLEGEPEPLAYAVEVSADTLFLTGPANVDFDGDDVDEAGTFDATLAREADKLSEGDGIPGAWVRSAGRIRSYRLHTPAGLAPETPATLLLAFHGAGSNGRELQVVAGLGPRADAAGALVVYPNGVNGEWAAGCDCTSADRAGIPDVQLAATLIDQMSRLRPVDSGRVFVTGFSQGAMLSYRIACELSERIAAVGAVASGTPRAVAASCAPARPVPAVMLHGTDDVRAPYGGNELLLSAPDTLAFWGELNGCQASVLTPLPDVADDGTRVTRESFPGCAPGAATLFTIEGGGHTWPGSAVAFPSELGRVSRDVSGAEVLFDFFSGHPLEPRSLR